MKSLPVRQFQELIALRMGLNVREQEKEALDKNLSSRIQTLKLNGADEYYDLLRGGSPQGEEEWRQLSILLTNQESYFFRDTGQFTLLRDSVLPELIQANRKARSLRIWSAGCSTGQEPYSLAILVDMLLPSQRDWKVFILGTDLSEAALDTARQGVFSSWSFRTTEAHIKAKYFNRRQKDYEIDARIRKAVTFHHGNLLQDQFPSLASGIHDIDLILCRNVFIYFKRDAVATVLKKFNETLRVGGYLLTGHAELHDTPLGELRVRPLPGSVFYQRAPHEPAEVARPVLNTPTHVARPSPPASGRAVAIARPAPARPLAPLAPAAAPNASRSPGPGDNEAIVDLLRAGQNGAALAKLEAILRADDRNFAAHCLAAQAHANAGRYEQATRHCERCVEIDATAPLPFHLLARIAEEQGSRDDAKVLLKKVNYLAPLAVAPYVELSAIYEHEGDRPRARKMRSTALSLLEGLEEGDAVTTLPLASDKPITVRELRRHLRGGDEA